MTNRTFTVPIAKLGESVTLTYHENSEDYVKFNGLKQSLNDAHSSVKREAFKTQAEFRNAVLAEVNYRVKQLVDGNPPSGRGGAAMITQESAIAHLAKTMTPEQFAALEAIMAQTAPGKTEVSVLVPKTASKK
jgi:hypothetical protein